MVTPALFTLNLHIYSCKEFKCTQTQSYYVQFKGAMQRKLMKFLTTVNIPICNCFDTTSLVFTGRKKILLGPVTARVIQTDECLAIVLCPKKIHCIAYRHSIVIQEISCLLCNLLKYVKVIRSYVFILIIMYQNGLEINQRDNVMEMKPVKFCYDFTGSKIITILNFQFTHSVFCLIWHIGYGLPLVLKGHKNTTIDRKV